jgi:hypothetical protein
MKESTMKYARTTWTTSYEDDESNKKNQKKKKDLPIGKNLAMKRWKFCQEV